MISACVSMNAKNASTTLRAYVRTYGGLNIHAADLKNIDFAKPGLRVIELENPSQPEEIT